MSTTENTGHHTRGATAAGIFEAPPPIYGPSEASPISDSVSVAEDGHNVSYPLATVPSTVVTGGPVLVERGSPGVSDAGHSRSEFSPLQGDADFGTPGPQGGQESEGWTPVTRKTARSHRERSPSSGSVHTSNINTSATTARVSTPSTILHAHNEMSREELETLARRYGSMAMYGRRHGRG
ncbi:hypothetical protein B0H14DRAFT_3884643 [Mycena olivaceomarginata]|nr:hypothetical protein B0H14DRAFT_3884643 [Mycena olivaceomarginata]